MAIENAQALAKALIDAAVAGYEVGLDGDTEREPMIGVLVFVPQSIATLIRSREAHRGLGTLLPERFCRVCGCTESNACEGGCYWVEPDLCSRCLPRVPRVLELAAHRVEVTS